MDNEIEVWRAHPDIEKIEVSTFGRVRTLDIVGSRENGTYSKKGHVLKQFNTKDGYLYVSLSMNGKTVNKTVHRLVAQAFLPNPDNLPQVNHKNCIRDDDCVSNLEWCTASYNSQYREKYGVSQTEAAGRPLFAVKLSTLEVTRFRSQHEASRELGVYQQNINKVIKGKREQAGGYWFKEDEGNGVEIDKDKLNDITDSMLFTGGIFAVNLNTLEVLQFNSQKEASEKLVANKGHINDVIKGKRNKHHGYWFVSDDENAVDLTKRKLREIGKIKLTAADSASEYFVSQVIAE